MGINGTERAHSGIPVQRHAQLVEQRRYEISVVESGLEALLEPYVVTSCPLRIPHQCRDRSGH